MSFNLSIALIAVSAFLLVLTIYYLRKGSIPLKYSLVWFGVSLVLLCCAFLPEWLINITKLLGFQTTSNLIIGILFVLLFVICLVLTIVVSSQSKKIVLLIQEVSMLKSRLNSEEKSHD